MTAGDWRSSSAPCCACWRSPPCRGAGAGARHARLAPRRGRRAARRDRRRCWPSCGRQRRGARGDRRGPRRPRALRPRPRLGGGDLRRSASAQADRPDGAVGAGDQGGRPSPPVRRERSAGCGRELRDAPGHVVPRRRRRRRGRRRVRQAQGVQGRQGDGSDQRRPQGGRRGAAAPVGASPTRCGGTPGRAGQEAELRASATGAWCASTTGLGPATRCWSMASRSSRRRVILDAPPGAAPSESC